MSAVPTRCRARSKCRWISLIACAVTVGTLWLCRAPILRGLAKAWIVTDTLSVADAAVVLGGGLENRPFAAAHLYTNHWVSLVLVMKVGLSPTEQMGLTRSHCELNRDVLLQLGVPLKDIRMVGEDVSSTYQEAMAVREWATQSGAKHLIIGTDLFHTRRVKWLFKKVFAETGVEVLVQPLESREYTRDDWWHQEQGLISFQNEVIKYLLYRWKYKSIKAEN